MVVWSLVLTVPSGSTVSVGVWFVWLGCGVVVLPCACTCVMASGLCSALGPSGTIDPTHLVLRHVTFENFLEKLSPGT